LPPNRVFSSSRSPGTAGEHEHERIRRIARQRNAEIDALHHARQDVQKKRVHGTACGFRRPCLREVIIRHLACGDLHNGFARIRCDNCGKENGGRPTARRAGAEGLRSGPPVPSREFRPHASDLLHAISFPPATTSSRVLFSLTYNCGWCYFPPNDWFQRRIKNNGDENEN
jgi:hypothetical protein